jgi:hypothetical protein
MPQQIRSLLVLALLALTGCATRIAVSSDHDPAFDFSGYQRFEWLAEKQQLTGDVRLDNPTLHQRIRSAIERELERRGYRKAESGGDFGVGYHLSLTQRHDVSTVQRHYGYGPEWQGRSGPTETVVTEWQEGTLVIDVVDWEADRLVWRGQAIGRVQESLTPVEREQRVIEAVQEMLAGFPPDKGAR